MTLINLFKKEDSTKLAMTKLAESFKTMQDGIIDMDNDEMRPEEFKKETHKYSDKYEKIGREIGKLVDEKNAAYGDSFHKSGEILKIFYPDGISVDQYHDVLTMVRIIDKQFRIATDKDAFGENPWRDMAGYSILQSWDRENDE